MSRQSAIPGYSLREHPSCAGGLPTAPKSPAPASPSPSTSQPAAQIADKPVRTRRKWLAAILTPLVVAGTSLAAHQLWRWNAERSFAAAVDTLRRQGEPVALVEFLPTAAPPDSQNAAIKVRDAGDSIVVESDAWQTFFNVSSVRLPLDDQKRTIIRSALQANGRSIAQLREAMTQPAMEWTNVQLSNNRSGPIPWSGGGGRIPGYRQRGLAHLLYCAALLAHQDGDDAAALARIEELLFLSHAQVKRPTLLPQLMAARLYTSASEALTQIVPELSIGTQPGDATPQQVRTLLVQLNGEDDVSRDGIRHALRIERARHIEAVIPPERVPPEVLALVARGTFNDPPPTLKYGSALEQYAMRPVRIGRMEQAIERLNLAIAGFAAADLREFTTVFPDNPPSRVDANGNEIGEEGEHRYTRGMTNWIQQAGRGHYICVARRRVAKLALAVKLYQAERGEWPVALDALVPAYLSAVPSDPLATAGEKLAYVPDEERRRVYSVGEDGIDDGGWPSEPFASRPDELRMTDFVVHLVPQPVPTTGPTTGPTTAPVTQN